MHGLNVLCLGVDTGRVALLAHLGHAGEKIPGVYKAAAQERVARSFGNGAALAREEGLVHVDLTPEHHGVCGDLLAMRQENAVVEHQLRGKQLYHLAVAHHANALLC